MAPGQAQVNYIVAKWNDRGSEEEITRTAEAVLYERTGRCSIYNKQKNYWNGLVNISFETGNPKEDSYLKWICFQPILTKNLRMFVSCRIMITEEVAEDGEICGRIACLF